MSFYPFLDGGGGRPAAELLLDNCALRCVSCSIYAHYNNQQNKERKAMMMMMLVDVIGKAR